MIVEWIEDGSVRVVESSNRARDKEKGREKKKMKVKEKARKER